MLRSKRGISPLIATVLIIGFTVALAAVIMFWGQSFQKDIAKSTQETTEKQLICAQDVVVDISSACDSAGNVKFTVKNDGAKEIKKFSIRFYVDGTNVATASVDTPLPAFGIETYDLTPEELSSSQVTLLELIPIIDIGGEEHTCSQTIVTFGDKTFTKALALC